jgi:peptide/nickel transport system permease protein
LVPGSPARGILGPHANAQTVAALDAQLHLNLPLWRQFALYMDGLLHGDLGRSVVTPSETVAGAIGKSLPITLSIILCSVIISVIVGVAAGLWAASTKRGLIDLAMRAGAGALLAVPPFVIGLLLITVAALGLRILPAGGWGSGWPQNFEFLVLPSVALAGYLAPLILRAVRQAALDVSSQTYIEAAVSRGIRPSVIVLKHMLPNCLLPVIALLGVNIGYLITGAVVVEAVFGVPGVGTVLVQAVAVRDYPIIQGITVVTALMVVGVNLIADIAYQMVDPRTRGEGT